MSKPTPQEIMKLPYERVLIPEEEGGYSAYIAEFEGCAADGETAEDALTNLNESAIAWVSAEQVSGRSIPEAWNLQEFSGKILLRLPKSLHQQLARQADREGVSLNQYIVQRLSADVRQDIILNLVKAVLENGQPFPARRETFETRETSDKVFNLPQAWTSIAQSRQAPIMSRGRR